MNEQKMFSTGKHSRGLTPQAVDIFPRYTQFYVKAGRAKLEQYHRQMRASNTPPDEKLIGSMELEIARAEQVEQAFTDLSNALQHVHDCNFREIAHVLRTAMLELGYQRIEDSQELYLVTCLIMRWLKSQNELFSREKFLNYINYGKEII
jgi:hypothetical protein